MPATWVILAALSAVVLGFYDVAKKLAVDRHDPLIVLFHGSLAGLAVMAVCWCATVWEVLPATSSFAVVRLDRADHLAVSFKSALVSLSWVCSYLAIRRLPISLAVPIRASSPVFTVVGAIVLFSERLRPLQWLAISLILAGYVGLSRVGRKEGIAWSKSPAVLLLVFATLLGAASGLYDKFLLGQRSLPATTVQFWFCFYNVLLQGAVVTGFVLKAKTTLRELLRPTMLATLVGVALVLADQLYFRALGEDGALIAVISMTRRSNVIISFVVGGVLLRETRLGEKARMLTLVLAGVVLLFL